MDEGLLYQTLCRRFGQPEATVVSDRPAYSWNATAPQRRCDLFRGVADSQLSVSTALQTIYGSDCVGGFLMGGMLKVATICTDDIWGLPNIAKLQQLGAIRRAAEHGAAAEFFMDAANVWYYGLSGNRVICYDAEVDELYPMGDWESAIGEVLDQWLHSVDSPGGDQ